MKQWVFECKVCEGRGNVLNPWFERCATDPDVDETETACRPSQCHYYYDCNEGELIPCENCRGKGKLVLSEKFWTLVEE